MEQIKYLIADINEKIKSQNKAILSSTPCLYETPQTVPYAKDDAQKPLKKDLLSSPSQKPFEECHLSPSSKEKYKSNKKYLQNLETRFIFDLKNFFSPQDTEFYLGNSSPIRHWDTFKSDKTYKVYANRGLNGIDGQLSTALGLAYKASKKIVAILGDLTTLYDLSAPWFWLRNKEYFNLCLIIINNHGGQIFSNLYENKAFINSHQIEFSHWTQTWGLSYLKCQSIEDLLEFQKDSSASLPDVIEYHSSKSLLPPS